MKTIINLIACELLMNLQLFAYDPTAQPVNYTGSSDLIAEGDKIHYSKTLIDVAGPKLIHEQFGDDKPLPENHGKKTSFRRYGPLVKADKPLVEGVAPNGQKLVVSEITATINQYGDFIPLTDVLQLTSIDNNIVQAVKLLGKQAGATMDTVVRDAINAGTNVGYASSWSGTTETPHAARYQLDMNAKLTVLECEKAYNELSRVDAPTFDDGYYVAIVHPDAVFDLRRDPEWIDAHKYAQPRELYKGEIGEIAGFRFVKSTQAKIWKGANLAGSTRNLTISSNVSSSKTISVSQTLTADELVGRLVLIGNIRTKITANTTNSITVEDTIDSASANDVIYPGEGASQGLAAYSVLFLAQGAYGVTDIENTPLETIIKIGEGPLKQVNTCGWKGYKTAEILVEEYLYRLEVCATKSATAAAN